MALVDSQNPDNIPKTQTQISGIRNTVIGLLGFIALIMGLFFSSFFTDRGLTQDQLYELGYYSFDRPREIKDFELINHKGEAVGIEQLKGTWSLVFFGFTYCPDICPTTLGVLNRAVVDMTEKAQVIMVSVDPERDTAESLSRYVPSFNPDFIGLTGEFDQIVALATQLNIAFGKVPGKTPGTYTVDHSGNIVVINPEGHYQGFIKSPHQATNIKQIANAIMLNH